MTKLQKFSKISRFTDSPIFLFYIRKEYFEWGNIGLNEVIQYFDVWRNQDTYIVLAKDEKKIQKTLDGDEIEDYRKKIKAIKCSKRGNDVYFFRMRKRLDKFLRICEKNIKLIKKDEDGYWSPILYLTLTYDQKRCSLDDAWKNIGKEWNRFLSYLKKKFGVISVMRTWESFQNGYPHIHAIVYFFECRFRVIKYKRKRFYEWRLYSKQIKEEINRGWHSFVDIQAIEDTNRLKYIFKYILKEQTKPQEQKKQIQTLAMLWLFRKRSFSISGDFIDELYSLSSLPNDDLSESERLDPIMHNSNWEFVGIFTASELGITDVTKFTIIFDKPPPIVLKKFFA